MRFLKILMLVISMIFMWNTSAEAVSFQFPHPNMENGRSGYDWLSLREGKGDCHLGDDYGLPEGTPIYPVTTGTIRYAGQNGSASDGSGWGYLIVIEHTLEDGSKINTVYGHVKPQNGITAGVTIADVTKAIGTIIYHKYGDHIHFGIFKGDYGASNGVYSSKVKGYDGACSGSSAPSQDTYEYANYLDPYDFIPKHSIGYTSTGPSSHKDLFQQTYFKEGVNTSYPYPVNYVHDWAYTEVQDLCKENVGINGTCSNEHKAMLIRNPNTGNVALLKGGFWSLWNDFRSLTGVEIGYPNSSEQTDSLITNGVIQHFENGIFYWDPGNRLASAIMDGKTTAQKFCWNGTRFQTTTASSCPSTQIPTDWISVLVNANTILSAYGGGSGNSPYTSPAGTGGCTATAPNLSYFLDKGDTRSITTTPEGDIYVLADTIYSNCQSTRNMYLSHDQGLTWELFALPGTPNPETMSLLPFLQHSVGFDLTNGTVGFLEGETLYTLPRGKSQPLQITFWDEDTYFYSYPPVGRGRFTDVCQVDAGKETCGWGSSYNYKFYLGEDSAGNPIIFGDYYQELTYRKGSYADRYYPGVRADGDIQTMIEDPTDPSKFLIFFQGGEIWEGSINATNFKKLGAAPGSMWYNSSLFRANPKNPNIFYLTYGAKMYRTTDRGKTWAEAFSLTGGQIDSMGVSWDGSIVYIDTGKVTPWADPAFAN